MFSIRSAARHLLQTSIVIVWVERTHIIHDFLRIHVRLRLVSPLLSHPIGQPVELILDGSVPLLLRIPDLILYTADAASTLPVEDVCLSPCPFVESLFLESALLSPFDVNKTGLLECLLHAKDDIMVFLAHTELFVLRNIHLSSFSTLVGA